MECQPNFAVRNLPPFALGGATPGGSYFQLIFDPGSHTVSATPFSGNQASGFAGVAESVSFTVLDAQRKASPSNLLRIWPNPIQDRVQVAFETPKAGMLILQIWNLQGQLIRSQEQVCQAGPCTLSMHLPELAAGVYRLSLSGILTKQMKLIKP